MMLNSYVPFAPGMITLDEQSGGHAVRFVDDFELEPFTDENASVYRILLKGTDAEALRRAADQLASRVSRLNIPLSRIAQEWPRPAPRAELIPRRDTPSQEVDRMTARLAELSMPPAPYRLHDGRVARVIPRGAPRSADVVPQRFELITREPSLASRFEMRDAFVPGGVTRELGRFVLPLRIPVKTEGDLATHIEKRKEIDRTVASMPLPPGIAVIRPSLSDWAFSLQKLRLLALATFLPVLLFAASAIALSSFRGAAAVVATTVVGVAAAAPALMLASASVDELTLLAMGASICCIAAIAVVTLLRARDETGPAYRSQRRFTNPTLAALLAVVALLAIPASAANAGTDGWRAPMLAALAVFVAGVPAAILVAPAIGFETRELHRRRTPVARAASHPPQWLEGPPLLAIRNVTKRYGDGFRALQRVSFDLTPGIIGLLGPNGAGKTTLLRVTTGLLLPTRGQVLYRGVPVAPHNLAEYRRLIGFLPQEFNAYAGLTAEDFLDFWALERGMASAAVRHAEIEKLLEIVGLSQDAKRRVRDFSGGMRQRIGIARALLGDPPLLVVDEPTTGLDLESRNRFRDLLGGLAADRIIILSTHIAGDVEATASRILLLTKGTLRWDGAPDALIARARGRVFDAVVHESEARAMTTTFRVTTRQRVAGGIHVRGVVPEGVALPGVAAEPTLEEAYLAEVASTRALRASGFAFLFEKGAA
jgi:ABC-2 type transport system ATP-binding protein